MKLIYLLLMCTIVGLGNAVPSSHIVHERREVLSSRWVKHHRIPGDILLPVRIGLTQTNLDKIHEHVMKLSDPKSTKYGQTWTTKDVIETFKPAEKTVNAVKNWLSGEGYADQQCSV